MSKIIFLKIKKYYFNIFLNKKYFKKQSPEQSPAPYRKAIITSEIRTP
jgi:hypothetical protein